jgi:hypothetical protein
MPPTIAHLKISTSEHVPYSKLETIIKALGGSFWPAATVRHAVESDWKRAWEEAQEKVERADAFVATDAVVLKSLIDAIRERIVSGARIVIFPDVNSLPEMNSFLSNFGLAFTSLRLWSDMRATEEVEITQPDSEEC